MQRQRVCSQALQVGRFRSGSANGGISGLKVMAMTDFAAVPGCL